jgi:agmatinase
MEVDSPGGFSPTSAVLQPRYTGIATLLRAEYRRDPRGLDIALLGIPSEFTVFRNGTRWGPCQIREVSRNMRPFNSGTLRNPFEEVKVADVGDAPVHPFSLEETNAGLEQHFGSLLEMGVRPIAVGGDHGVTLPILRVLGKARGPLGVLQIDAHHDTHDELYGTHDNHATMMRRAVEEGLIDPSRVVQVGLRGSLYGPDELDWAKQQGFTQITADEFNAAPVDATARAIEALGAGPAYLTLDIDGLDPTVAPGTGVMEPGGLSYRECVELLRGSQGADFLGADLTEVSPPLDPSGRTAMVAANLLFEELCLVADGVTRSSLRQ